MAIGDAANIVAHFSFYTQERHLLRTNERVIEVMAEEQTRKDTALHDLASGNRFKLTPGLEPAPHRGFAAHCVTT